MLNTYLKIYLFVYLAALGLSCGLQTFSCGMWALIPQPGIESGPPASGRRSQPPGHQEVPISGFSTMWHVLF